jgi:hypothetical protein
MTMTKDKTNESAIQAMIFDRTDPDQIVCVTKDGSRRTRLDEIKAANGYVGRNDMAMVNIIAADGSVYKQECIFFTTEGISWGGCKQWFTKAEQAELRDLWRKMVKVARQHPEMAGYLSPHYKTDEKVKEVAHA